MFKPTVVCALFVPSVTTCIVVSHQLLSGAASDVGAVARGVAVFLATSNVVSPLEFVCSSIFDCACCMQIMVSHLLLFGAASDVGSVARGVSVPWAA